MQGKWKEIHCFGGFERSKETKIQSIRSQLKQRTQKNPNSQGYHKHTTIPQISDTPIAIQQAYT